MSRAIIAMLALIQVLLSGCALDKSGFWSQTNSEVTHSVGATPDNGVIDKKLQFERNISSWNGRDINELISRIGPPTSTYRMPNGNTIYIYDNSVIVPAFAGGVPLEFSCVVNFEADKGTSLIVGHSYKGCIY